MASIPGLNIESVADLFIEAKYGKQLEAMEPEDKKKQKQMMKDYMLDQGKTFIEEQIANITSAFDALSKTITQLPIAISQTIALAAIPSVITVGAAASAPNPAYSVIDMMQKKNTIMGILNPAKQACEQLQTAMDRICFPVPAPVQVVMDTIVTITEACEAIPG